MAEYRLYFLDDRRAIKARQGFYADSDDEAREVAELSSMLVAIHALAMSYGAERE